NREEPLQCAFGPALVYGQSGIAQRPDTAENETAVLIHPEGGKDLLCIPCAFPPWQDRLAQIVAQRLFPVIGDVELECEWYGQIGMTDNALPRFH
ncbi:hypothetical protein ACC722_38360, partial [Rhizobium ruizarguesonis]